VLVVDLGDRIAMRPAPEGQDDRDLQGKYAGRGPDSAAARKSARRADAARRHK
jgi:hypothetical protein